MHQVESNLNVQAPDSLINPLLSLTHHAEPIAWHQVMEDLHAHLLQLPQEIQPMAKVLLQKIQSPDFILPPLPNEESAKTKKKTVKIESIAAVLTPVVLPEDHVYFQPLNRLIETLKTFQQEMQPFTTLLNTAAPNLQMRVAALVTEYEQFRQRFAKGSPALRKQLLRTKPILQGHYGTFYLQEGIIENIFPVTEEGSVTRLNNLPGTHSVNAYRGLHFKVNPDAPGVEYSVHALATVMGSLASTPSLLVRLWRFRWKYPVLVTKTVPGEGFDKVLLKQVSELSKLNPQRFGEALLVSWLVRPQDGKAQNYIYSPETTDENSNVALTYRIVNIDQDMSFADTIAQQSRGLDRGKHTVETRDILYLLPNMANQVPKAFREQYAKLSALELVSSWLDQLSQQNERYAQWRQQQLFSDTDFAQLNLPICLRPGTAAGIYQRLARFIAACQTKNSLTWWDLFNSVDPTLCRIYQRLLTKPQYANDPMAAYEALQRHFLEDWLDPNIPEEKQLLDELPVYHADANDFIRERTQSLHEAFLELMLEADFSSLSAEQQQVVFMQWARWGNLPQLKIHNAASLDDKYLYELTRLSKTTLKQVSLLNCPNITEHALYMLVEQHASLSIEVSQTVKATFQQWPTWAKRCAHLTLVIKEGESYIRISARGHETLQQLPSLWLDLARQNSIAGLSYLFKQGVALDTQISGETALHVAAKAGQLAVVKWLIQEGIKLDMVNQGGHTPLYEAIVAGQFAIVDELLQQGARWDVPINGSTPAHALFQYADNRTIQRLTATWQPFEWETRLKALDQKGQQILHRAALNADTSVVAFCLARGSDPYAQTVLGFTALHLTARQGNLVGTEALLKANADPESRTSAGVTPLKLAKDYKHTAIVQVLEQLHNTAASQKILLPQGNTPLHEAAFHGRLDDLQEALKQCEVNRRNDLGRTALHLTSEGGALTVKVYGLEKVGALKRAKKFLTGSQTQTELIESLFIDLLEALYAKGANINAADRYGDTPLLIAIGVSRSVKIIDWLIRHGADIFAVDHDGNNIFHKTMSTMRKRYSIAKYLLEQAPIVLMERDLQTRGQVDKKEQQKILADRQKQVRTLATQSDVLGQTPLHLLAGKESEADEPKDQTLTLELYFKHISTASFTSDAKETPLHFATGHSASPQVAVLRLLVPHMININAADIHGKTALHWLVLKANEANKWLLPEIQYLLEQGADPDLADNNEKKSRRLAQETNKEAVFSLIKRHVPQERVSQILLQAVELRDRIKRYMGWDLLLSTLYNYLFLISSEEEQANYRALYERYRDVFTPIYGARLVDLIKNLEKDNNNVARPYSQNQITALPAWIKIEEVIWLKDMKTLITKRQEIISQLNPSLEELRVAHEQYKANSTPEFKQKWIQAFDNYQRLEARRQFFEQLYGRTQAIDTLLRQGEHYQLYYQTEFSKQLGQVITSLREENNRYERAYYRQLLLQIHALVINSTWLTIWDQATIERAKQLLEDTTLQLQQWEVSEKPDLSDLMQPSAQHIQFYADELLLLQDKIKGLQDLPQKSLPEVREVVHDIMHGKALVQFFAHPAVKDYRDLLSQIRQFIFESNSSEYMADYRDYLLEVSQQIDVNEATLSNDKQQPLTSEQVENYQQFQAVWDYLSNLSQNLPDELNRNANAQLESIEEIFLAQNVGTTVPALPAEIVETFEASIQSEEATNQVIQQVTFMEQLGEELTYVSQYRDKATELQTIPTALQNNNDNSDVNLPPPPPPPIDNIETKRNLQPTEDLQATQPARNAMLEQIRNASPGKLKTVAKPTSKTYHAINRLSKAGNPLFIALAGKLDTIHKATHGETEEESNESDWNVSEDTTPKLHG